MAHSKYGGNDGGNALGTGMKTSLGRCCYFCVPCLSHNIPVCYFQYSKKRCSAGLVAVAVADVSHTYCVTSPEKAVYLWWHDCTCVS